MTRPPPAPLTRRPEQGRLFGDLPSGPTAIHIELDDAEVELVPELLAPADGDRLLAELGSTVAWSQETIVMYGRRVPVPRLSAWYGDRRAGYAYSGIAMEPQPWIRPLLELRERVEAVTGDTFNSVLVNLYRDGGDGVAWHSDDERELGAEPVIGSVSLGATRRFQLRHVLRPELRHEIQLAHGSLLVMRGPTQRCWRHQVPKTAQPVGPRVNLTFRRIG